MFSRIQVPLDGSHFSEQALPWAEMIAKRFDAELDVVTVHEPTAGLDMESWDHSVSEWSRDYIEALAHTVQERSGRRTTGHLRIGGAVSSLVDHAERSGCDLVVAATHGRGALSRAWLGSVADGLLRHADRPVLLIRPDDEHPPAETPPPATPFRRILVPLDGTDFSSAILEDVIPLAKAFDATVALVRVVPFPMEIASPYLPTTVQMNQKVVEEAKASSRAWLGDRAEMLSARGIEVDTHIEVATQPARAICDVAADVGADLILMATHGRGGLGRALLGSTADKVVRSTHIPVLVHRPAAEG